MCRDAVDDGVEEGEDDVGGEVGALRHGARHDGGGGGGEGQLEHEGGVLQAHVVAVGVHEEVTCASWLDLFTQGVIWVRLV